MEFELIVLLSATQEKEHHIKTIKHFLQNFINIL
jgi:hypothetical protein